MQARPKKGLQIRWASMVMGALLALPTLALPHDGEIVGCAYNLPVERVKLVREWVLPNGLYAEAYDRNEDEREDIVALSTILGTTQREDGTVDIYHATHPTFYVVDLDLDGEMDAVYVDKTGSGRCEDIVLYKDLFEPSADRNPVERGRKTHDKF